MRTRGECSHEGEYIIGRFFLCSVRNCDGRRHDDRCSRCGSAELYDFSAPLVPEGARACRACGGVRWQPA